MRSRLTQFLLAALFASGQPYDSLEDLYSPDYGNEVGSSGPPAFTSAPLHLAVTEGDTVRLPCIVERLEGFVLLWKRGKRTIAVGGQLLDKSDSRLGLETEENGSRLVIRGARPGDGGEYSCQVSAFRPPSLQHSVRVRVRPTLETLPSSQLTVERGEPAALSCSLTSGTASRLYWRRDGRPVADGGSLVLGPAQPRHAGRYQCVAEQEGEEVVREVRVSVLFSPVVQQEEAHVRRRDGGREVQLSCHVTAHPAATVSWRRDGRPLQGDTQGLVTASSGDLHTLYLLSGGRQTWGEYTCTASNSRGSASRSIQVSAYPDEAVLGPAPLSSSPGSLRLQWTARSDSPVTVWRVQFKAPQLGGDWSEVDVGAEQLDGDVWAGTAELLGLRPDTRYQVKISGRNREGYSQFSRPVSYTTPERGAVKQPSVMASTARHLSGSLLPALVCIVLVQCSAGLC